MESTPRLITRVTARILDVVLLVAADLALGQLIGFGFDWLAIAALLVLLYFAGLDVLLGATIGKLLLGLRVLGPEGKRPTVRQAVAREAFTLLGAIPFAGPLLALVAWTWIVLSIRSSPLGQGKHDMLAGGTRVIRLG